VLFCVFSGLIFFGFRAGLSLSLCWVLMEASILGMSLMVLFWGRYVEVRFFTGFGQWWVGVCRLFRPLFFVLMFGEVFCVLRHFGLFCSRFFD
jgi:hypothetical protein